jgi:hypothetical protein
MEQRGRKSSAALTLIGPEGIATIGRPEPDATLTEEQAHEWRDIVNRLPAEWFPRETWGLLAAYCRHLVSSRRVAALIQEAESAEQLNIDDYDKLLKMQEREGRALSSLATRMRISQQSTLDREKRKPARLANKPWQSKG